MGELNMKPFSIGEYLKNPNRELVTRVGRKVRVICTDRKDADYPIVALISNNCGNGESTLYYTEDGKFYTDSTSSLDLFFAPEKHEGWVNIYSDLGLGIRHCKCIFDSEEEALRNRDSKAVATVKIEWEE